MRTVTKSSSTFNKYCLLTCYECVEVGVWWEVADPFTFGLTEVELLQVETQRSLHVLHAAAVVAWRDELHSSEEGGLGGSNWYSRRERGNSPVGKVVMLYKKSQKKCKMRLLFLFPCFLFAESRSSLHTDAPRGRWGSHSGRTGSCSPPSVVASPGPRGSSGGRCRHTGRPSAGHSAGRKTLNYPGETSD